MSKYIVLVGETASGKDTILKEVMKKNNKVKPIISHTSRPMRVNESEGKEYYFVDEDKMISMINNKEFAEHRRYKTESGDIWFYGVHKDEIKKSIQNKGIYIVILDIQGLKELTDYVVAAGEKDRNVISIFIDAPTKDRMLRSLNRDDINDKKAREVCRRILADHEEVNKYKEMCCMSLRNKYPEDRDDCVNFVDMMINILND